MNIFNTIFAQGEILHYKKKSVVVSPLQPAKGIYLIKNGFLYSYRLTVNNKKRVQNIIKSGEIFPLLQYTTNTPNEFYIETLTPVTLSLVKKSIFFDYIYSNKKTTKEFIQALSVYLYRYVGRVDNFELETVEKKVIGRLLHLSDHFGFNKEGKIVIEVPVTQTFLAESINISRENASRELNKLKNEKLVSLKGKTVIILNKDALLQKLL